MNKKQNMSSSKNIYLVRCSSGSWDNFNWWIGGIFEKQEDAEELANKLNDENKKLREECPIQKYYEDMTDEEEEQYDKYWSGDFIKAREWNGAEVIKYAMNKSYISENNYLSIE